MKQMPTREQVQKAYASVHKYLRENTTGLSQEELAERSGSSKDHQSRLECADRGPSLFHFIKDAIAMGADPVLVLSMVLRHLGL